MDVDRLTSLRPVCQAAAVNVAVSHGGGNKVHTERMDGVIGWVF